MLTTFLPITKPSKNHDFRKPPKFSKIRPDAAKVIDFGRLGDLFWYQFSLCFTTPGKFTFCNMYNAKTSFLQCQASNSGIKNQSTNHVFSNPFLGPHFSHLFLTCLFWDPLQNPVGAKWDPKSLSFSKLSKNA